MSIVLPIALEAGERALWESPDAGALLRGLAGELALLGREHPVVAMGRPEAMPAWVRSLGVPVRPVPAMAEAGSPLLPPGALSALGALAASPGGAESRVAIVDFRSPLLSARTVLSAMDACRRDGRSRISVAEARLNAAIAERTMESLAVGQVALVDEAAAAPDLPAALRRRMGEPGPLSRPFPLDARALSRPAADAAAGVWHAMVVAGNVFEVDPGLPHMVPASSLDMAKYSHARVMSALLPQESGMGRRLFPASVLSEPGFLGMDPLWRPEDATVVCLRRNGIMGLWVSDAFDHPSVRLRVWPVAEGRTLPESVRGVGGAPDRVQCFGRTFAGPVVELDGRASSLVWRLERPAGAGGDFVEPVRLRRELWDIDPATGVKRNCVNGECIFGRQNYPENLMATQGLWVGRVGDGLAADPCGAGMPMAGVRVCGEESVSVRDRLSLLRAVCAARRAARAVPGEQPSDERMVRAENF